MDSSFNCVIFSGGWRSILMGLSGTTGQQAHCYKERLCDFNHSSPGLLAVSKALLSAFSQRPLIVFECKHKLLFVFWSAKQMVLQLIYSSPAQHRNKFYKNQRFCLS